MYRRSRTTIVSSPQNCLIFRGLAFVKTPICNAYVYAGMESTQPAPLTVHIVLLKTPDPVVLPATASQFTSVMLFSFLELPEIYNPNSLSRMPATRILALSIFQHGPVS